MRTSSHLLRLSSSTELRQLEAAQRNRKLLGLLFLVLLVTLSTTELHALKTPTTIALSVSPDSGSAGMVVTLTATVTSSGVPVFPGRVLFCEASAHHCTDNAIVGAAQLTANGTATIKKLLGAEGDRFFCAYFQGTTSVESSTSAPEFVTVTGKRGPTVTTITKSGGPSTYTLTATATGVGFRPLTGSLSFVDTFNPSHIWGVYLLDAMNAGTPQLSYSPLAIYDVAVFGFAQPQGLAVGDFNGDGLLDLITINGNEGYSSEFALLFGDPNNPGQFVSPPTRFPLDGPSSAIATDDLNGDGVLDLVVNLQLTSQIAVLLGDANHPGQFLPAVVYPDGAGAQDYNQAIAIGDLNGDGLPDIVVANPSNTVSVLLADGAHPGQFLPPVIYAAGNTPNSQGQPNGLVLKDFNGDGWLDLGVTNLQDGTIVIFLADSNHPGTFLPGVSYPALPASEGALASADINQDGIPDLVMATPGALSDGPGENGTK